MSKFSVEKSIEINAPGSQVSRVFTDPTLTRQMGGEDVSEWEVGSSFAWKGLDGKMLTNGTITRIEPERLLQHTLLNSVGSTASVITYEFDESQGVTTIHAREDFTQPIKDIDYRDAAKGWDAALRVLKNTAERQNI